jgi:excinuclease UvrABC nuclease subunit
LQRALRGLVAPAEYAESVRRAALFLEGKSDELASELGEQMQAASEARFRAGRAPAT